MATTTGTQLATNIRQKAAELEKAYAAVSEAAAGRAPEGHWSAKENLSHLCGPEGGDLVGFFQAFLDKDVPTLNIAPEQTHFAGKRAQMTVAELVALYRKRAEHLAAFAATLSPEQLARTAHIPQLAKSPWGDHPSLGALIDLFGVGHVQFHLDHLHKIEKELAGK